jgi:carbon storage regulator
MLILMRKKNERILINHDISIVVVEVRGDKVRLGIEAPEYVVVHRQEVYDAIQRDKQEREVAARIDAGEPIHEIEDDLDHKENQA